MHMHNNCVTVDTVAAELRSGTSLHMLQTILHLTCLHQLLLSTTASTKLLHTATAEFLCVYTIHNAHRTAVTCA
jgi:hypothetical protein